MTAPTPPLVDVIAAALAEHWTFSTDTDDYPRFVDRCDGCGEVVFNHGRENNQNQSYAAHQARAVLAAISEAGAVEVVTGYGVKLKSGDVERTGTNILDAKEWLEDFTGGDDPNYEPVEVVTRTTTIIAVRTDWTAVTP